MRNALTLVFVALTVACGGVAVEESSSGPPCTDAGPQPPAEASSSACSTSRFTLQDPYVYDVERPGRVWYRATVAGETPVDACLGASLGAAARPATAEELRELKAATSCSFPAPFVVEAGQLATTSGCIDATTGASVVCEGWWRRSLCVAGE